MRISIDFDGTMWSHMGFFREFMRAMQSAGHQVGVLTGHSASTAEADIRLMIARGFPRPDFYLGRTTEYLPFNGAKFKLDMIRLHGIDYHFDDFDYDNPETTRLFDEVADIRHRIVKVRWREPHSTHYE